MNLTISGHHVELTPSIREYVQNKLERIKHHFDYVIDVTVILAVDKLPDKEKRQRAEVNLRLRGKDLHVESIAQDLYAAIDTLIDKLDRQLVKYKSKLKDHQRNGIKNIGVETPETEAPEMLEASETPETPEEPGAEARA